VRDERCWAGAIRSLSEKGDRTLRGQLSGFGVRLLDADDPYTRFVDEIVN
jgi:hypothetical protein